MCLNHKEIMASEYSLSIVRDVYLLQAQFVREWLTSPTSVLFCSPSERSPEFQNSSTSASRAARQLGWSLEPDRQGVKLSKDLRSFRITLWHSKRRVTFTTFPIALFCLPVSYWYVSAHLARPWRAEGGEGWWGKGCRPRPKKASNHCGQTQNSALGRCWKCETVR